MKDRQTDRQTEEQTSILRILAGVMYSTTCAEIAADHFGLCLMRKCTKNEFYVSFPMTLTYHLLNFNVLPYYLRC